MNRIKFMAASLAAGLMGLVPTKLPAIQKMSYGQNIPLHLNGPHVPCPKGEHICENSLYEIGEFIKATPDHLKGSIEITAPGNYPWILEDPSGKWIWRINPVPGRQWYSIIRDA
jgi:hypothetical protein